MLFTALLGLLSLPLPLALGATIPGDALVSRNEQHSLAKRAFNGRATFYDVGLGSCGQYNVASDFIVALNSAQYGGGYPGPNCFKSITISYGGKTAQATIMDQCPSCGYGDLDFSRSLFNYFGNEGMGVFQMSWWFNDGSQQQQPASTTPTSTYTPPTSTYTPPTSTYTPPTSTYTPPPPTSTSTPPPPSSSTPSATSSTSSTTPSSASSSATSSSVSTSSSSGLNIAVVASATTISGSVVPLPESTQPSSNRDGQQAVMGQGNLAMLNSAVTNYGNIIVVGAGARGV